MTDREKFEEWWQAYADTGYVKRVEPIAWSAWQAATDAALPATAPTPLEPCEVCAGTGFLAGRFPGVHYECKVCATKAQPATAPAWHDAQQAEIESLRWTVKDALESLDNGMTADCRATLSSATKETP